MSNVQFMARGASGEIWLYDQIGGDMLSEGITSKQFAKDLTAMGKVSRINVRINSPGGSVRDGVAIYNLLKQHPAQIVVDVDGMALSIASVIAMAADPGMLRMAANAQMMIHDPQGFAMGSSKEMLRTAAILDQTKGTLVATYKQRSGMADAQIAALMEDETWFTAEAAVQNGFADTITTEQPVAACFDLAAYQNVPAALKRRVQNNRLAPADDIQRVRANERALALRQRLAATV